MQDEFEMFKIVVVGSSGTGKTNISTRYMRNQFHQSSQATLGVEFLTKMVEVNSKNIKISLWDTAGQERYKALSKVYYKGATGVIVVYDITDAKTYIELESWMRLVNQNLNIEDIVLMIVGNKVDREDERQVPAQRPQHEFQENFGIDCWQVSAKTGFNIQELFKDMITKIIEKARDNIKGTVFRGTAEYQSERGTYIKADTKKENLPARNSSIIFQEEEEMKTVNQDQLPDLPKQNKAKNWQGNRMTLTVTQHKQKLQQKKQNKKKKKCC